MIKEILVFTGGLITGATVILSLDDKKETVWTDYNPDSDG